MIKYNMIIVYALSLFACPMTNGVQCESESELQRTIEVFFEHPSKYSDLRGMSEEERNALYEDIQAAFVEYGMSVLKESHVLQVNILDIDLPGWTDSLEIDFPKTRHFLEAYPPRIKFDYRVMDGSKNEIRKGTQELVEYDYLNFLVSENRPADYFESMIAFWVSGNLRGSMDQIS